MFNKIRSLVFVSTVFALMCSPGLALAHGHDYLFDGGNRYVRLEANRVIIQGDTAKRAIIEKTGALRIGGQSVPVSARDQRYLADYYDVVFDIRHQAKSVAKQATSDAFRTVGDVLGAVFSGADSAKTEAVEENKLRQTVHADIAPLCQKVAELKTLQDKVARDVPAFQPYTILKRSDVTDCQR